MTTIGESSIVRLTALVPVSDGVEESVTTIETGYVPAVTGVPDSCPVVLNDRPGGNAPVSDQVKGGAPPLATVNV